MSAALHRFLGTIRTGPSRATTSTTLRPRGGSGTTTGVVPAAAGSPLLIASAVAAGADLEVRIVQLVALLDTIVEDPDEAAFPDIPCRVNDAELWFAESPADVEAAKALCRECPVVEMCLAGALERREPWGVWGGQLFIGGVVVARKRPRGRPRKCEVAA